MTVFHTQEKWHKRLTKPIPCTRDDAWLGEACYFWRDLQDAEDWGENSKRRTGTYEIYQCQLESDKGLDTVFNEEHYRFWLNQLEKIAKAIIEQTGEKPTLKELNDYIRDTKVWPEVDFIQFQDLPANSDRALVKPIEYSRGKIRTVAFRKRIQVAVYNYKIVKNFSFLKEEKCKIRR